MDSLKMQQDQSAAAPLPPLPPSSSSSSTVVHDSSNSLSTNEQGHQNSSVTAHPYSTTTAHVSRVESTLSYNLDKGLEQNNRSEIINDTTNSSSSSSSNAKTATAPEKRPTSAANVSAAPGSQAADITQAPPSAPQSEVTESGTGQEAPGAGQEAAPAASRMGSRFSVNLSGVGLPSMASNLGLTQANGERAADMAQDLKKNVVNMWHAWFPTPPPTSSSSTVTPTTTSTIDSVKALLQSPNSGSQSLSIHSQQHDRPSKNQRLTNSYSLGSKAGSESFMSLGGNRSPPSSQQQPVSPSRGYSLDIPDRKSASASPVPSNGRGGKDTSIQIVHEANDPIASRSLTCVPPPSNLSNEPIYLMGKLYPPSPTQWTDFQQDFTSGLIWCTYRHSYPPIKPSTFNTDVGWGCMLRSGQGLLANALAIQFMGRGNSPSFSQILFDSV
ncbi:Cysteine protease atg4c [Linnemannia schmuckeri]|uniref:Cysteine protease n=1 Tax=Linnemannia schmuckeri TaxID=64567 RepID=A0A9P5S9R6_9FUNG|nr:Cysteine protease atg4c [Linnemannia schmuckeri]